MKTEAEIREHLADLAWLLARPCICRSKSARLMCRHTQDRFEEVQDALLWVVGERSDYRFVIQAIPDARRLNLHPTCVQVDPTANQES